MSFDVTIPAFYIVFYGTLVEISFSFGCEKITFVKALFCPLQSSAFFCRKQCSPIIVWVGGYTKMLGVNIYLAIVKRELTDITMDLMRVKCICEKKHG